MHRQIWMALLLASADLTIAQPALAPRLSYRDAAAQSLKAAISVSDLQAVLNFVRSAGTNDCLELDEDGRTALHYAVSRCALAEADANAFEILRTVAARTNCVNIPDRGGLKPILQLRPLAWNSRTKVDALEILLAAGADVNAQDEAGNSLLHDVLSHWTESAMQMPQLLQLLVKAHVNPNLTNSAGDSPVHVFFGPNGFSSKPALAAGANVPVAQKVFVMLSEAGADLGIRNREGTTPFGAMLERVEPYFGMRDAVLGFADPTLAAQLRANSAEIKKRPALIFLCDKPNADPAVVHRLLALNANASAAEPDGFTALHGAAWFFNYPICSLLLARGANAKAVNDEGRTPLHELVRSTFFDSPYLTTDRNADVLKAAELLLGHGADPRAKDKHGKRPGDLLKARRTDDPERAALLRALKKKL